MSWVHMLNPASNDSQTSQGQTPEFERCTLCDLLYHRTRPWLISLDHHPVIDRMRNTPALADQWMTQQLMIQRAYNDQIESRPIRSPASLNIVHQRSRERLKRIVQTRHDNNRRVADTTCLATRNFIAMMSACSKNCSTALLGLWFTLEQFEPSNMCTRCPIRCASTLIDLPDSDVGSMHCWLCEMESDTIDIPHRLLIVDAARESARAFGEILNELDQISNDASTHELQ